MIALKDLLKFNQFGQREDPPSSIYLSKISHDIDDLNHKISIGAIANFDTIINKLSVMYMDIWTLNGKIMQENRIFREMIEDQKSLIKILKRDKK